MHSESLDGSSWESAGTLWVDDDAQHLRVRSKPVLPLILAAILLLVAGGLVVLAIWDSRQPPSLFEQEFPGLAEDDVGVALFVGLGVPVALGWAAFEMWRSRRFEVVFDRVSQTATVKRWWPLGFVASESVVPFDQISGISLGGQLANRGGLFSTATVELSTSESHQRLTGWIGFEDANRLQLQMLSVSEIDLAT